MILFLSSLYNFYFFFLFYPTGLDMQWIQVLVNLGFLPNLKGNTFNISSKNAFALHFCGCPYQIKFLSVVRVIISAVISDDPMWLLLSLYVYVFYLKTLLKHS